MNGITKIDQVLVRQKMMNGIGGCINKESILVAALEQSSFFDMENCEGMKPAMIV